jgi:hypothetical protein
VLNSLLEVVQRIISAPAGNQTWASRFIRKNSNSSNCLEKKVVDSFFRNYVRKIYGLESREYGRRDLSR